MNNWKSVLVSPTAPILDVIRMIDDSSMQIALVVDEQQHLLGTVTDGDIRRAVLRGIPFYESVEKIMFIAPTVARLNDGRDHILALMKSQQLRQIPVVDEQGCVAGLEILERLILEATAGNWVFLMAGGLGSRLRPLTYECPKPLIKVGNKPILENILQGYIEYGFRKFFISVNYMSEMVEDYFGDGRNWGVEIEYVREQSSLGTAGSLRLLPELPKEPLFVMNGDLLTKINYRQLLDFHDLNKSKATMCIREYQLQVPYGVVKVDKHSLVDVEEKPIHHFFVNAGIYLLDPEIIRLIPEEMPFDMPDLFKKVITENYETAAFPVREYWMDIGRIDELDRARGEYPEVFK